MIEVSKLIDKYLAFSAISNASEEDFKIIILDFLKKTKFFKRESINK